MPAKRAPSRDGQNEADELVPQLQSRMEELRDRFPELASSVETALPAAQPEKPAAVLHGAQSACQVAFKDQQASEAEVASLELGCNELLAVLRWGVSVLQQAQVNLIDAWDKYYQAARTAQLEVQRTRPSSSNSGNAEHVQKLFQDLDADQLQQMAVSFANAAKAAREEAELKETQKPPSSVPPNFGSANASNEEASLQTSQPAVLQADVQDSGSVPPANTSAPAGDGSGGATAVHIPPGGSGGGSSEKRDASKSPSRSPHLSKSPS